MPLNGPERRRREAPIVVEPPTKFRIDLPRKISDGLPRTAMQFPSSSLIADFLLRLLADGWNETTEDPFPSVCLPGPKREPQKIKLLVQVSLRPSEPPTSSLRHWLSGSSPSAPAAESNSRTTSDSRSGTGSFSSPFRNPRSTAHPGLPPLDCSLPSNRLPRPPIGKYRTALLHLSGSSPCGLA